MKKCFILDWDGTATDNNRRVEAVLDPMISLFSGRYGISEEELTIGYLDQEVMIRENEREHPWIHRNRLAAYCEDPLIYNNRLFVNLLNDINPQNLSSLWREVLRAYGEAYRLSLQSFCNNRRLQGSDLNRQTLKAKWLKMAYQTTSQTAYCTGHPCE